LQENQAATEALIDELSKYKQGYDEMQEGIKKFISNDIIIYLLYLAFVDHPSRVPSRRKKRAENQDEPYVDVKVFFLNKNSKIKKKYLLESINA
jgi:hypothetical protein